MIMFDDMGAAGYIPSFLNYRDPRGAVEQLDDAYSHGGGWMEFHGFTLHNGDDGAYLSYQGDPNTYEVSRGTLRDETIIVFEHSWVAVVQPDGAFNVARMT